jgi:hypothetical protein
MDMGGPTSLHLVVDDFLPSADSLRLLAEILAAEEAFTPSPIGSAHIDLSIRSSLRLPGRAGVDLAPLKAAMAA